MYKVYSESDHISEWRFKIIEDSIFFLFPLIVTVVCYLFILVKVSLLGLGNMLLYCTIIGLNFFTRLRYSAINQLLTCNVKPGILSLTH